MKKWTFVLTLVGFRLLAGDKSPSPPSKEDLFKAKIANLQEQLAYYQQKANTCILEQQAGTTGKLPSEQRFQQIIQNAKQQALAAGCELDTETFVCKKKEEVKK